MIKRTLYFGNSAYLSKKNEQLLVRLPEVEINDTLSEIVKKEENDVKDRSLKANHNALNELRPL